MIRQLRWLVVMMLIGCVVPTVVQAQAQQCFAETGQCISGRIQEFWKANGGLPVFGLPITPQGEEQIEGRPIQVQSFERNRLELHPENARPNDVLLGRLGADRLAQQGRDWFTFPKSEQQPGCRFFPETGHNVCGDILRMWRANGLELDGRRGKSEGESLALFGMPLSDLMAETLSDGREYQVQYFERARFELHPENAAPNNVLLGLLGSEIRAGGSTPQPPAPPAPAPTAPPTPPQPPPPSFNDCRADPNPGAAPNYPLAIMDIDKRAETVTLQNVSPDAVDLSGWIMCSITGNQRHPIGGTLAPGETRIFPGAGGPIWNNNESDPGALYNPQGQLISYYPR